MTTLMALLSRLGARAGTVVLLADPDGAAALADTGAWLIRLVDAGDGSHGWVLVGPDGARMALPDVLDGEALRLVFEQVSRPRSG